MQAIWKIHQTATPVSFGSAASLVSPDLTATRTRAIQFLRESQERLRTSIAALGEDSELLKPRKTNWGEMKETRWIIAQLIEHDHYHAGEINHIRSLRSGDDRWAHERSV